MKGFKDSTRTQHIAGPKAKGVKGVARADAVLSAFKQGRKYAEGGRVKDPGVYGGAMENRGGEPDQGSDYYTNQLNYNTLHRKRLQKSMKGKIYEDPESSAYDQQQEFLASARRRNSTGDQNNNGRGRRRSVPTHSDKPLVGK